MGVHVIFVVIIDSLKLENDSPKLCAFCGLYLLHLYCEAALTSLDKRLFLNDVNVFRKEATGHIMEVK